MTSIPIKVCCVKDAGVHESWCDTTSQLCAEPGAPFAEPSEECWDTHSSEYNDIFTTKGLFSLKRAGRLEVVPGPGLREAGPMFSFPSTVAEMLQPFGLPKGNVRSAQVLV